MTEMDDLRDKMAKMKAKSDGSAGGKTKTPALPDQAGIFPPLAKITQPKTVKDSETHKPAATALILAKIRDVVGRIFTATPTEAEKAAQSDIAPLFTVLTAALTNDTDGAAQAYLVQSLAEHLVLKFQSVPKEFALPNPEDPAAAAAILSSLRHTIAQESGHLMIWGDWTAEGYRLRFSTAQSDDGAFGLASRLDLPAAYIAPVPHLLYGSILSSAEAVSPQQKDWIRQTLPTVALMTEDLSNRPPVQMSMAQQRSVQVFFGHIAMAAAANVPQADIAGWQDKALTAYRSAQKRISRSDPLWEAGMIHRHVANLLNAKADKATDPIPSLTEAAAEWRQAVDTLTRASMPHEWAATQIRLGNALYRLDLATGDTELLREALQSLQSALQVYSRTETPQKWAEVMHDIAQVLQVYGDQLKKPEILHRAIDACEQALNVYSRDRMPLSWAAVQNTLGTALFLYDRHKGGNEHLPQAQAALEAALEMFKAHGAKAPAKVAERNLAHVYKLAQARKNMRMIDPDWTQQE